MRLDILEMAFLSSLVWHPDEMVIRIDGEPMYLWRAVDHESEVLDLLVQRWHDKRAALTTGSMKTIPFG
jgi:transposase-like protein